MRIPGLLFLQTLFLIPRFLSIPGFLSRAEGLALRRAARSVALGGHVVEIGSWKGKSTYCLSRGLKKPGRFTVIDPFNASGDEASLPTYRKEKGGDDLEQVFRKNLRHEIMRHDFTIVRGNVSGYPAQSPPIDLLFIDGDHSFEGISRDFNRMESHLKCGGLLLLHDCATYSLATGPRRLQERILQGGRYRTLVQVDSLWVAKKITT